jgi:GT2 family glycosyltransferase
VHYARYVPYTGWAYRRRDIVRVGGFDEALESAEDVDLGRRIVPAAGRIVYVPEALWYHREPRTLSAFLRRRFRAGAGNILYKMRERRAPAPLRAGIMMIALAIVIAAAWWMAANGAARALPLLLLAVLLLPAVTRARFISRAIRLGADARYAIGWVYLEIAGWIAAAAGSLSALLRGHERTRHSLRGR